MFLLVFLRFIFVPLAIVFIITQIMWPLLAGTVLFPMFRKSRETLLAEKQELEAQLTDQDLADNVTDLKNELARRQAIRPTTTVVTATVAGIEGVPLIVPVKHSK